MSIATFLLLAASLQKETEYRPCNPMMAGCRGKAGDYGRIDMIASSVRFS